MHADLTHSVADIATACSQSLDKLIASAAVLVVHDEPETQRLLQNLLASRCALLEVASSAEQAEALRLRVHFDLILVNTELPGLSGLRWVNQLREHGVLTRAIFLSEYANVSEAVEALRNGADDFLTKPFDAEKMLYSVERSLTLQSSANNWPIRNRQQQHAQSFQNSVIGDSAEILNTVALALRVAPTQSTVLLQGETGTGKELIANTIHNNSQRSGHLVAINCGSISNELFESELFGHVKGAFTGATQSRDGLLMHANKGTVFLDEISELPAAMQTKLLRVLEERKIRPVGSEQEIPVDVRIIAATNRDLAELSARNEFRQDLYYRLNVLPINIPPLRNRTQDIEPLVLHFMQQLCKEMQVDSLKLMHTDWQRLKTYPWPGNVRELRNVIERTLLLGRIPADSLRNNAILPKQPVPLAAAENRIAEAAEQSSGFPMNWQLADVERAHIEAVLKSVKHNKSAAARILGVSRKTLERKQHLWYPENS